MGAENAAGYGIMIVMDKVRKLFLNWCDFLVEAQITEKGDPFFGGFRCESCSFPHGRADNAIYPLVCAYDLTREARYLDAAKRLLVFRKKLTEESGAVHNDFTSEWRGITAFSAINLFKTLRYFGDLLPAAFREEVEGCARASAEWVHRNMEIGFSANVNYYCAAALVNALYAERYHDAAYEVRARALLAYCMRLFTVNGFLSGEGQPHDGKSPNGCLPIDIGYIVEESLPCLIHAATLLGDEEALCVLTENARKLLDFMLPDGGWDNSFGVRNNKWTYYGSRTSDGVIGAFCALAARDPIFAEAADRTFEILEKCTRAGRLYGGAHYYEYGQKACVHHAFCHAGALADALLAGISERKRIPLPTDDERCFVKYYPEIGTYKIGTGRYLATLTAYDYATYTYPNGAAHAGGGTLSLLFKRGTGPMIAGSVYDYRLTEKNNMQLPTGARRHATLLVRAEYEKEGRKYATCLDKCPEITVDRDGDVVTARVRAMFFSAETQSAEDESRYAEFYYRFAQDGVTIRVGKLHEDILFLLPLVEGTGELVTENPFVKEPIFFLTGGFAVEEYAFSLAEEVTIKII